MIHIQLSIADGSLMLCQVKFNWPAQRMIETLPRKEWTGVAWRIPLQDLFDVWAKFAGAGQLDMFPDVAEELRNQRRLREKVEAKSTLADVKDYTFKTKPYAHQVEGFLLGKKRRRFAFLMEMGTGKTKVAIDVVSYLLQMGQIDAVLVLAPKAVLFNWEREVSVHSPLPKEKLRTAVLTGPKKAKILEQAANSATWFVTNYETVLKMGAELRALCARRRVAILCDESTELKNPSSKTFKEAEKLTLVAKATYIMTGSPITQSPLDAYAQFRLLDKNILGHHTFTSFKAEYAVTKRMNNIPVPLVVGYRNLERLASLIKPHSLRVLKADCLDLPAKVYRVVELEMGLVQGEKYRQMEQDSVITHESQTLAAPLIITRMMRLQQIASGFYPVTNEFGTETKTISLPDAPKLAAMMELVNEALESKQKVIVWCRFLWEIEHIEETLLEAKVKTVTYYGEKSASERQQAVDDIQNGDAQVFVGQIQTGGMGITLTACSVVIYFSNSFSLAERLQSEDRPHRIGQTRSVTYVDLVMRGSIDRLVLRALKDKKNLADIVTGDNIKRLLESTHD